MKRSRLVLVGALVCSLGLSLSCGDSPTAVTPKPQGDLIGSLLQATGLLKCSPLPYDSTSATINGSGGWISVGPHTLYIPPGALSQPTTITAVLSGAGQKVNGVQFRPEGLEFNKTAYLTMSYANCNLLGSLAPKHIAYTTDAFQILYYVLSLDNLFARKVTGQVHHFSQYAVAW
ncbi:MAG TPA: hypothetical protein VFK78_10205 [Gemmatimonadales bacterium]|nr:hypothetical protein [Gemmatimonadales bacterium]